MTTKGERSHMANVADIGCIVCRNAFCLHSPAEVHHIGNGTMGKRSGNFETIPLCPLHHRLGGAGVAVHAGRKSFESNFGTERELLAQTLEIINGL